MCEDIQGVGARDRARSRSLSPFSFSLSLFSRKGAQRARSNRNGQRYTHKIGTHAAAGGKQSPVINLISPSPSLSPSLSSFIHATAALRGRTDPALATPPTRRPRAADDAGRTTEPFFTGLGRTGAATVTTGGGGGKMGAPVPVPYHRAATADRSGPGA